MNDKNEMGRIINNDEYAHHFWDYIRANNNTDIPSQLKNNTMSNFPFPSATFDKLNNGIHRYSVMRQLATSVRISSPGTLISVSGRNDLVQWISVDQQLPVREGLHDFTRHPVRYNKLGVVVKLDEDIARDNTFDIEDFLIQRLAKSFALAEDKGFINGTDDHMPAGILHETAGATVGVTAETLAFDDLHRLYFSLDGEYRLSASWLMNDETAFALRSMKDDAGHYLWDPSDCLLMGRPVSISNEMPSAAPGKMPLLFGDFSYYWIIECSPVSVRALKEYFARVGQTGYLATELLDGRLIRRTAVKGLKIGE